MRNIPVRWILAAGLLAVACAASAAGPSHGNRHHPLDRGQWRDAPQARSDVLRQRAVRQARRYADVAVSQAREARRLGWYPDHPRWSLRHERHFRWALRADAHRLDREIRRRAARLRELRLRFPRARAWRRRP